MGKSTNILTRHEKGVFPKSAKVERRSSPLPAWGMSLPLRRTA